jgi:pantoate--beta-alanine ligase
MLVFSTVDKIRLFLRMERESGRRIAFVPTMGALHEGHLSLIRRAISENDICVCSIFVNPIQFNEIEDFNKYPRPLEKDLNALKKEGCHAVFVPEVKEIYPENSKALIKIELGNISEVLEGKHRPGHFDGVVRVVKRLFDIVEPHCAYFGQKDYQQYLVICTMTEYFDLKIQIIMHPIIRAKDGLALSSRNVRLSSEERIIAPLLYHTLQKAAHDLSFQSAEEVKKNALIVLEKEKNLQCEYFEVVNAVNLQTIHGKIPKNRQVLLCAAIRLGTVRLIDNILITM